MAINFNADPYYDDFDETKNFHRILFKPGVAVQARELTQLQTSIQNQIKRFGDNIFKEGTIVHGGERAYDRNYEAVKLQASYNDGTTTYNANTELTGLIGDEIYGITSGVRALVVNVVASNTAGDPPTIYVKYTNSGTNKQTYTFADNEVIINSFNNKKFKSLVTNATAIGTAYTITAGVAYVKGYFVYFPRQTLILNKYENIDTAIVVFNVNESIRTFTQDSTLLDPASGSYNFAAPGADRYYIELVIGKKEWQPTTIVDDDVIELARIQGSNIIKENKNTEYAVLQDTLARRTYDESGDYIVRPFDIKVIEHLQSPTQRLGYYTAARGGTGDKFVAQISAGKAYVQGYEVEGIKTSIISADKARDTASVTNGSVFIPFGNSIDITNVFDTLTNPEEFTRVDLYNRYVATPGSIAGAGTKIGTARVSNIQYISGTVGSTASVYRAYLFDIQMESGFSFTKDVKALYQDSGAVKPLDFTADVAPTNTLLTGTISVTSGASAVTGVGTRFTSQLRVGDYISFGAQIGRVNNITNDLALVLGANALTTVSGANFFIQSVSINDQELNTSIFPMPAPNIETIDPTGVNTSYSVRRAEANVTLSGGQLQVIANSNETFSSFSTDNYQAWNNTTGAAIDIAGKLAFTGINTIVTLDLSSVGYTNETITFINTRQLTSTAADKKTKTLVANATLDKVTAGTAAVSNISLEKADGYRLVSVVMDAGSFATPAGTYTVDITSRYTFDNGQRLSHYAPASISLKSGAALPTAPIRITFDYFNHSFDGTFFTVDSYTALDYKDIPTVTISGQTFVLRDCVDFRPRMNDAGTGFSGTGGRISYFPDFENDLITSYEYYLPRIDKLVLSRDGELTFIKGQSSLKPKEPEAPTGTMTLYIFKQKPYVFDLKDDIEIVIVDNRRYTMRGISKLEERIKNVEYYTSLNLLEQNAQNYQIKDQDGLDRFKNGFVVDSFSGHGIGDVFNNDYSVSIDFDKEELRPMAKTNMMRLEEVNTSKVSRLANGYVKVGDMITLPYKLQRFISNNYNSTTTELNPFKMISFAGKAYGIQQDYWFEENILPDLYTNENGNYDSLKSTAVAKGTYGTVWGGWEELYLGKAADGLTESTLKYRAGKKYEVKEYTTNKTKTYVKSSAVIPKMRDINIDFHVVGLKPNTRIFVFFDNINVTNDTHTLAQGATQYNNDFSRFSDIMFAGQNVFSKDVLATDESGEVHLRFQYKSSKYDLNTGTYTIRVSDSADNNPDLESTGASMTFTSSGELRNIVTEHVATRNARLIDSVVKEEDRITNKVIQKEITVIPVAVTGGNRSGAVVDAVTVVDEGTFICTGGKVLGPGGFCICPNGTLLDSSSGLCEDARTVDPAWIPSGTFIRSFCSGFDLYYVRANGIGGELSPALIRENDVADCGYVAEAISFPAAGTDLGFTFCRDFHSYHAYTDGKGGTYTAIYEQQSVADCNFEVPINPDGCPNDGTFIESFCIDNDEVFYYADGSCGVTFTTSVGACAPEVPYDNIITIRVGGTENDINNNAVIDVGEVDTVSINDIVDPVGVIDAIAGWVFGITLSEAQKAWVAAEAAAQNITAATFSAATVSSENILADGRIDVIDLSGNLIIPASYNAEAESVANFIAQMITEGAASNVSDSSAVTAINNSGGVGSAAAQTYITALAIQATTAIANSGTTSADIWWKEVADVSKSNGAV